MRYRWFAVFALISLASCSQNTAPALPEETEVTLRAVIEQKNRAVAWTQDVSPKSTAEARRGILMTPENAFAFRGDGSVIYPVIEGFGSLDTSLLGGAALELARDFCRSLIQKDREAAAEGMNSRNTFLLDVFFFDTEGAALTENYVIGRPEILGNIWQIPVRFFLEGGTLDVLLYLNQNEPVRVEQFAYGDPVYAQRP
ncbi:MAG: hypothetical protein LBR23_03260 [Spirochaetaceae bacterium]|jgi:hypothetical protein|nr:hypothetical protein [Spirochaetaceae bacterium]